MSQMPWMKFYPNDWLACSELLRCTWSARGLWVHILCLMHQSPNRGRLIGHDDKPLPDETIVRMCGAWPEGLVMLSELESAGVFSRDRGGAIVCRRMVRDDSISSIRAEAGRAGGEARASGFAKAKCQANFKQMGKQNVESSLSLVSPSPEGGAGGTDDLTDADLEPTRLAYPRSAQPLRARASLRAAIARLSAAKHGGVARDALAWLDARVRLYAKTRGRSDKQMIPYFHNWLDAGGYAETVEEWRTQAKRIGKVEHDGY